MPEETPIFDLPYPTKDDGPKGPEQMQLLAQAVEAALGLIMPAGTLLPTGRATSPSTSFLLCEGQAVSRTTYAALFAAIGTKYGTGNGTTTFNLPDLRGRVPVGVDGAAGRLTANDTIGAAAGEEKHVLSIAEIAVHNHGASGLQTQIAVQEKFQEFGDSSGHNDFAPGFRAIPNWGNQSAAIIGQTQVQGGGSSHNNMQPYQVVNFLIKT